MSDALTEAMKKTRARGEAAAATPASPPAGRRPSRQGKKGITVHFDPAVVRQLKLLGVEQDRNNQDLLKEALNLLFVEHGKLPIA